MPHDEEAWLTFWRNLAIGVISLLLAAGGLAIGIWSRGIESELTRQDAVNKIQWERLSDHATHTNRLSANEREIIDLQGRLREVEIRLGRR